MTKFSFSDMAFISKNYFFKCLALYYLLPHVKGEYFLIRPLKSFFQNEGMSLSNWTTEYFFFLEYIGGVP